MSNHCACCLCTSVTFSKWKSFHTFCTSCLHFSTLSCSFFCWSGVMDCSALLLASLVIASFSSLHARWYDFLAVSSWFELRQELRSMNAKPQCKNPIPYHLQNFCMGIAAKISHSCLRSGISPLTDPQGLTINTFVTKPQQKFGVHVCVKDTQMHRHNHAYRHATNSLIGNSWSTLLLGNACLL